MKILRKLIQSHKILFFGTMSITFFTVLISLYWNSFLADLLNRLKNASSFEDMGAETSLPQLLIMAAFIILIQTISEYLSSFLASYTCELFAHEMRTGYARFYLQSDVRTLLKRNAGEEQSAMQNELSEISAYLNENLFSLTKQLISFVFTVVFLFCQSPKLMLFSTLPVLPLILYCSFSSKVIKSYSGRCQESKRQINGLTGTLLELFPIIQVYRAHGLISATMHERILEWQSASIRKERVAAGLMSLSGLLSFIPLLLLLGVGGAMVIRGEITIGIFYIFINLSGNVSGFLQNMPNIYAGFRQFSAAVGRLEKKLVL